MSYSGSASSSIPGKGASWTYRLRFIDEPEKSSGSQQTLTQADLKKKLLNLISGPEPILQISLYKTPLSENQWTNLLFNHQYVVFQTNGWWWSLEKNSECLILQRSKKKLMVRDYREGRLRCKTKYWDPQLIQSKKSGYKVSQLVEWISDRKILYTSYDFTGNNCKHFASQVFDRFSQ